MACCPHGHEPTTSNLLRRICQVEQRSQVTFRLQSESSHCSSSEDVDDVRMVVEVRTRLRITFTVPSPEQGRSYLFEPAEMPEARSRLAIHGDLAQRFSSLEAALLTLAPLLSSRMPSGWKLGEVLGAVVGRFARATVASAEINEEQGPIRVLADVEYLHMLRSHQEVDDVLDRRPPNFAPAINTGSSTLGTCAVCLREIKQEWLRTIHLPCSHAFHLNCISPWLQRSNSCPMCRGTVPLIDDDAGAIASGFVFPV